MWNYKVRFIIFYIFFYLRCKFDGDCNPSGDFTKINANFQLILTAYCLKNCGNASQQAYILNTYTLDSNQSWILLNTMLSDISSEFNFKSDSQGKYKFELATSFLGGLFSLIVLINQVPQNGTCQITPVFGVALITNFDISCSDWQDLDGFILKYDYFANFPNQQMKIGLGYSLDGLLTTLLPYNSDGAFWISVEIHDNNNGIAYFNISYWVTVEFNSNVSNINYMSLLNNGDSQVNIQNIISISLVLSIFNSSKNSNSNIRDQLAYFINNISISDTSSIRTQSSMLAMLTQTPNEISRSTGDAVMNQCIRLSLALQSQPYLSMDELKEVSVGLVATLGNLNSAMSIYLNGFDTYLESDYMTANALPEYYDTDLDNFWAQSVNFDER